MEEARTRILIVIPARYGSTRLPGKPLIRIAGIEMIRRVAAIAAYVSGKVSGCSYVVATDDERVASFCERHSIPAIMTSPSCNSGTERCWDAVQKYNEKPAFIINLQGDNPLCPPWFLEDMITEWERHPEGQVFTPYVQLEWNELDAFYEAKKITPHSGTTVEIDRFGFALTFSKLPLPAIRKREALEKTQERSPIRRHIGLYGYTYFALEQYFQLEPGQYEEPEGLEQMRFIENRIPVKMVEANYRGRKGMSGVDSIEDVARAEAIISQWGEFSFGH